MQQIEQNIFLDFETYYDKEVSLKKLSTAEYVRHPKFKVLGCGIAIENQEPLWYPDYEILDTSINWTSSKVIAHNCLFDGFILEDHLNIHPAAYACTQTLTRAIIPHLKSYSLAAISKLLNLGEKTDGLQAEGASEANANYCINDTILCRAIFQKLNPLTTTFERELQSLVLSWGCNAQIHLDIPLLKKELSNRIAERLKLIKDSKYTETRLRSNPQFVEILKTLNLKIPYKISKTTNLKAPALAKNDIEWQTLKSDNPEHRALFKGREAAASNINITRTERFLNIAQTTKNTLPMPLIYYGAHTSRFSGTDKLNVQNLPNLRKSNLRRALIAPKDYVILVVDSAQIELRLNAWLCEQNDILEALHKGEDPYIKEAAIQFNIPESEVTKQQRAFGKAITLACGYQMGAYPRFYNFCRGGPLGMDPILISKDDAYRTINTYRTSKSKISEHWTKLQDLLPVLAAKTGHYKHPKGLIFKHNMIEMPADTLPQQYPNLFQSDDKEWLYGHNTIHKIYGGKLQENIVQKLARDIVMEQILILQSEGFNSVSSTHDEGLFLVHESEAKNHLKRAIKVFSTPPKWCQDVPLSAEGGYDYCYNK